ncbi:MULTISPECIES: flagellar motor protein MotB [unclassified Ruegeria]|uniref:flagellar motor protein MotB n=1 Tax=unclassified Ruegeria TaxID=2625375 RepID=UPI001AD95217|nr:MULTISPECIES: flagellar motor protein MotB [unclassified Ruegeria]MBO9411829.1 OmpA family protein [Ruegeria sp. R8_1]MBO9415610.1 OmpA family protein [Ruegeria sp. R8_2]
MGAQSNAAPIIIKKKRVSGGDGHHGGAWKVAYADFVTAMMAFFMLMWLLNATTEKQRKGLADYFSPTIPVNPVSGGGDGAFGGNNMFSELTMVMDGSGASQRSPTAARQARGSIGVANEGGKQSTEEFSTLEARLMGRTGESMVSDKVLKHIVTRVTDEGLVVELFDTEDQPLFESGSDTPTAIMRALALLVARSSDLVTNDIAVEGHVGSSPVVVASNPVWTVSTSRAQKVRQMLQDKGVQPVRLDRVTGHADREIHDENPMAARNNRIEIIFLRNS